MSTVAGGIVSTTLVSLGPDVKVHANVHTIDSSRAGTMSVVLGEHPATISLIGTPAELERALRQAYSLVLEQIPAPAEVTA